MGVGEVGEVGVGLGRWEERVGRRSPPPPPVVEEEEEEEEEGEEMWEWVVAHGGVMK